MGIEGRDYFRESSRYTERLSGWHWDGMPPVCKWIIIINVVVYLLQIFVMRDPRPADIQAHLEQFKQLSPDVSEEDLPDMLSLQRVAVVEEWLQMETSKVLHGQVWRLLTYAFCHERWSVWHILVNLLFFYLFGPTLESMYGSREFLLFYLTAAIVSSLAYMALDLFTDGSASMIGASGAVMAVMMLYAIFYPRRVIYVFYIIPIEVRWLVLLKVVFDLHPVLLALAGDRQFTGVAHAAHLGGLAFGFLYWKLNLRLEPWVDRIRLPRWDRTFGSRRGLRVHRPEPEADRSEIEDQVDAILRKIHQEGEASLTEVERQILQIASQRYQNRRR